MACSICSLVIRKNERNMKHRMSLITDHSEAVWALFNNELASDRSRYLLFSASASGSVMGYDVEHGKNEKRNLGIDATTHYPMKNDRDVVVSLASNTEHSKHLFCGHLSGQMSMVDVETQQVVHSFTPLNSNWEKDSVREKKETVRIRYTL